MPHLDGAHHHGGGGAGWAVLLIIVAALAATAARALYAALAAALTDLLIVGGSVAGVAIASAIVVLAVRSGREPRDALPSRQATPDTYKSINTRAELHPPSARALPPAREVHNHVHLHGLTPDQMAEVLRRQQED
jgi:hypothetical protein